MFSKTYLDHLSDLKDPHADLPLEDIPLTSDKILSLTVRNRRKIRNERDCAQIIGALKFIQGLEYHYNNFTSFLHTLANTNKPEDNSALAHEAVAYLHRLGQFYYFVKSLKLLDNRSKINELYLFRRKHVGHRSIDDPFLKDGHLEDKLPEQIWQAGCFSRPLFKGEIGPNFNPEKGILEDIEIFLTPKKYLSDKAFISFQIISNGDHATFTPQKDHPILLREIEQAYTQLFSGDFLANRQKIKRLQSHFGIYAVIEKDQNILLVKKSKGPYRGMWDLPGGKSKHGEKIIETLQRKVRGETNIELTNAIPHTNQSYIVEYEDGEEIISLHHTCLVYKATQFDSSRFQEKINQKDVVECTWFGESQLTHLHLSQIALFAIQALQKQ
jgi:ADP-ribose pyrophosphatase YjhB (NUDIX family)